MIQLRHANILGLKQLIINDSSVIIVSEMMHMNLLDYINKKQKKLTEDEIRDVFK